MSENISEEQFLFAVRRPELAEALHRSLEATDERPQPQLRMDMHSARVGTMTITLGDAVEAYAISVHEVPTLIETYKSHNHVNLVKSADIGQAVLVHEHAFAPGGEDLAAALEALTGLEQRGELPQHVEFGVTPPMASGAQVFRKQTQASPKMVEAVETQIIDLMHGEAPEGWVIEDVAEVFLDEGGTGRGKWVPLSDVPTDVLKSLAQK